MSWPPKHKEESLSQLEAIWIGHAKINHQKFVVIVKDLEDASFYPMYFFTEHEVETYQSNIISESKVKVIKVLEIEDE